MPGYIHTCEKCGSHMQVHERYLGRSLRCTSCRTEFLAMLPADAQLAEAVPVEIETSRAAAQLDPPPPVASAADPDRVAGVVVGSGFQRPDHFTSAIDG